MKNMPKINKFLGCCLLISILMFSCQSEELQDNQIPKNIQSLSLEKLNSVDKATMASSAMREAYVDCETTCIVAGSGNYFAMVDSASKTSGQNIRTVSYEAYNTETQFIVNVLYETTGPNQSNKYIHIIPGIEGEEPVEVNGVSNGEMVTWTYALPMDWEACDQISFTIEENILPEGQQTIFDNAITYSLIGICPCEESFSYEHLGDNSYVFTYSNVEAMENAVVQFTCPHIVDFTPLDGKEYSVNPGNGPGAPTVLTWIGDLEACSETTFAIVFDADCDQNNANFANIFTDFKVNGDSKKGDASNIKFICPE
ncbi:hypothetical protein [Mangrovimonas sp. TPBH4]|uniref:hypothetical protein n=1 Tax=Mangrovimonas sp. TPBH4 TaxID=1645914 RepID=UPI0006B66174|nr:hypothetical protein [Mangrovimonas sp. TPBH4]